MDSFLIFVTDDESLDFFIVSLFYNPPCVTFFLDYNLSLWGFKKNILYGDQMVYS